MALFAESVCLMVASAVVGLILAMWGTDLVKLFGESQFNRLQELRVGLIAVLFAMVSAVVLVGVCISDPEVHLRFPLA